MKNDCPGVVSEKPQTQSRCDHVQCNQATTYERVLCRLSLKPEGVKRELELEFNPEACRAFQGDEQAECLTYYKSYWPCWKGTTLEKRVECAKGVLELKGDVAAQKAACKADEKCLDELYEHAMHLIVFRFYDLEQRAEAWMKEGVDAQSTAKFVTKVVENKIAFLQADTKEDRLAIIETMRSDWRAHVAHARTLLKR